MANGTVAQLGAAAFLAVGPVLLLSGCSPSAEQRIDRHLERAAESARIATRYAEEVARAAPGSAAAPGTPSSLDAIHLQRKKSLVFEYRSQAEGQASAAVALAVLHYGATDPRCEDVRDRARRARGKKKRRRSNAGKGR